MTEAKPDLSYTLFEKLLAEEFSVQSGDQLLRFKLIEVTKHSPATAPSDLGIRQDGFSLLFKEVTNFQPGQGTFMITFEFGTIDLFLVPVRTGEYESVFN